MDNDFDDVEECRRELVRVVHYLQSDFASAGHARQTCNCTLCYVARTIAQLTHDLSEWQHSSEAERRILAELIADRAATTDEPRGCACPGQCAAIADLAAERAAKEAALAEVERMSGWCEHYEGVRSDLNAALAAAIRERDSERAAKEAARYEVGQLAQARDQLRQSEREAIHERDEAMSEVQRLLSTACRPLSKEELDCLDRMAESSLQAVIRERDEARRELAMMSDLADALRKERDDGRETISRMSVEFAKVTTKLAAERDEARSEVEKLRTYNRTFEPLIERLTKERDEARERLAQVESYAAALQQAAEPFAILKSSCNFDKWDDDSFVTLQTPNTRHTHGMHKLNVGHIKKLRAALADGGKPGPV